MIVKNAELSAVAVNRNQYPHEDMKEIAIAGRSNVGKSSLINYLLNRKKLARTSSSPGKTRTINFYDVNDDFRIVDLPGYGYAKVAKSISAAWGEMIEDYLKNRPNLIKVVQLVDVRHPPGSMDIQMYKWLEHYGMNGLVVATKSDKLSNNQMLKNIKLIRQTLNLKQEDLVIPVSALKRKGRKELLEVFDSVLKEGR